MKVWAGPEAYEFRYIWRSLRSLLASDLGHDADILIFDDCSPNPLLQPFLKQLQAGHPQIRVFRHQENKGPNRGQAEAFKVVDSEYPFAPFFVTIDDDVIYNRAWLQQLLRARQELTALGIDGLYSAINIPFRKSFATLHTHGRAYLLKWKQPALNWLIPRQVYQRVGQFEDQGVAYDTAYSHVARLHRIPVICLSPSLVQHIGVLGAYSRDTRTQALDFVGEGGGDCFLKRLPKQVGKRVLQAWDVIKARRSLGVLDVAPIRWGAEWVYDEFPWRRVSVATFPVDDSADAARTPEQVAERTHEITKAQLPSPVAVRGVRRDWQGRPTNVECLWSFLPNLREFQRFDQLYRPLDCRTLLDALVDALIPLHHAGVVHNKIRQENVYISQDGKEIYLAWMGTEPTGAFRFSDRTKILSIFGSALDGRASEDIRERAAVAYLESVAPEVMAGAEPTFRSDVFAVAAVVASTYGSTPRTLPALQARREAWFGGLRQPMDRLHLVSPVLTACLSADPFQRPADSVELKRRLQEVEH